MITDNFIIIEDGIPIFNPEAKLIKEFKTLIERDKGSEGDAQGRKKLQATKELAFISLYENLKSAYNRNYEPERRTFELKRGLKLPEDWKIDKVIEDAMRVYRLTQVTPSSEILTALRKALMSSKDIIGMLEKRLIKNMEALKTEEMINGEDFDKLMAKCVEDIDRILTYGAKIEKQLQDLDTLENKYVKEVEEMKGKNKKTINKHQL